MTRYGVTNWYDDKPCPECNSNGVVVYYDKGKMRFVFHCGSCGKTWTSESTNMKHE